MTPADVMSARLEGKPDPVKEQQRLAMACAYNAAQSRSWVRIFYGDPMTGQAWPEEHGIVGRAYLARDGKTPCMNGMAMFEGSIVAILNSPRDGWRYWYKHPDFTPGVWSATDGSPEPGYAAQVSHNGQLYANCRNIEEARRLRDFMVGRRMTKGGKAPKA